MSNKHINNGGPAFPGQWYDFQPCTGDQVVREQWSGMTLRDYFAAKAMQSFITNLDIREERLIDVPQLAKSAYNIADAMLKAREASND